MNGWMKFNIKKHETSPKQIQRANSILPSSLSLLNWFAQYGHTEYNSKQTEKTTCNNSQTIQCHEHTSCLSGCHVRGQREILESSIKLRHGPLRHNSTHTLHHHPGTERSSIGHSFWSVHTYVGQINKNTDTIQFGQIVWSSKHKQCSRQKLWKREFIITQQTKCQAL